MEKHITVVQLNDSHAYLEPHSEIFWEASGPVFRTAGGYARISSLLKQIRAEKPGQVLFCDCGDTLHGTYPAVKTKGRAVIPALNALQPQAMTAHWEFAYTPAVFEQETTQLNFPMLAANIYREESGEHAFPTYHVVEIGGLRVGLTGLASNIVDKSMPPSFSQGLDFTLGLAELPGIIRLLREQEHVDLVVLISHLGFPQDMKLLEEVPGVDLCLSAHTHHRLRQPARIGQTLLIQSGCHGSFLGRIDLTIEGGRIRDYRHGLIEVREDLEEDPEVRRLVEEAVAPYRQMLSEPVGETAVPLFRGFVLESSMDNLILDALLERTGAELAFSNGWRYGAPVPPGPVTLNDLYNMLPVDPPVSTIQLTGQEVREMLEENLEHTFSRDPFKQMGGYLKRALGLRAYIKIENPPGHRLQELYISGQPVQPDKEYLAAFITAQGVPQKYGRERKEHPDHMVAVLREYLSRRNPYTTAERGTFTAI